MSQNKHQKAKKKSFLGKIFSHTSKTKKRSTIKSEYDKYDLDKPIITTCDVCDEVLFHSEKGDSLICHENCGNKILRDDIETSVKRRSDISLTINDRQTGRSTFFSNTLKKVDQEEADFVTIKLNDNKENIKTNNDDSYVFNTIDNTSIQKSGLVLRKMNTKDPKFERTLKESVIETTSLSMNKTHYEIPNEKLIKLFNNNDQGLVLEQKGIQLMGKMRIVINLLRPIKMILTARPPSIYDTLAPRDPKQSTVDRMYQRQQSMFWLERGTTTMIYINVNSTTEDVINQLLNKYTITNNPKKFALYLHVLENNKDDLSPMTLGFHKLTKNQCPLKIIINWCEQGVDFYQNQLRCTKFVLQENDPEDIEWDKFSVPELKSFLDILNSQEEEKRKYIDKIFDIRKKELTRLLEEKRDVFSISRSNSSKIDCSV